ncbi:Sec63-domain-containing protein [Scleroderma citrinum]
MLSHFIYVFSQDYLEVVIPPAKLVPPKFSERSISISELDELGKGSFPGYTHLNRVQSIVYPTAYQSNENMLICGEYFHLLYTFVLLLGWSTAPTGAGKTDVAMLTILRVLNLHRRHTVTPGLPVAASIDRDRFKIIYVAPMKALASEITHKLGRRLNWLSVKVRELTGDMQLTKAEIAETQIIVTTPEKWDVVTRKPVGEGELGLKLKLLIIDEVHLLNEDRGAVIETIVARTLRQAESTQSVIRIVGLSATLPNYIDVADFLSVSRYTGLFYFDSSFRPIPLEQHFIGIRGKPGSVQSKRNLDRVTFEKVSELVKQGHQVMVFVHARKETVNAAFALKDAATADGTLPDYSCEDHPQWHLHRRNIGESRNKVMKQLFDYGFGIHHAGMLRSDRNLTERLFRDKVIKVLCCTATLAWGVNLPAHAVIIKGTQVYDSGKGSFVDLSVLDVLQVFGRAGRPGLETSGEGYICTTEDKLPHYLNAVTSQTPIESKFLSGMTDALNAEIALGTVSNVGDGIRWLGYTYLFVRMQKNPFQYGLSREAVTNSAALGERQHNLITNAARQLTKLEMIDFSQQDAAATFTIKDVGRIAAKYYIRHQSIEVWGPIFKPEMSEADVLRMLSTSTEFNQIQVRESEVKELEELMGNIPCEVYGGVDTNQGKANILFQAHISRLPILDSALISDTAYVAQNGARIVRALLEIAISRKWASTAVVLAGMSKAVEKCMWPFDEPMKQFPLKDDIIYGLTSSRAEYSPSELSAMTAAELGKLIRLNEHQGRALLAAAKQFPLPELSVSLRPLGSNILKIVVSVARAFDWNSKIHGSAEPFWLWVEGPSNKTILQIKHITLRESRKAQDAEFIISLLDKTLPSVTIRLVSDRWLGADNELDVPLNSLPMPPTFHQHTQRQDAGFLPLSLLRPPALQDLYDSAHLNSFNAIQTQVFWSVISTLANVLVAAPVGSGKSFLAHLAVWSTLLRSRTSNFALVIVPNKTVEINTLSELRSRAGICDIAIERSSGNMIFSQPKNKIIRVVTAAVLLDALRLPRPTGVSYPALVLCENLEHLDDTYELAVSLLRHATQYSPCRYIGLSRSLNDPSDLASWLGVKPCHLHSFLPKDREQSLICSVQTHALSLSESMFKALAKPAYTAMRLSFTNSAIVVVPSPGHCQLVAQELITQHNHLHLFQMGFLPESASGLEAETRMANLREYAVTNFASRGVGIIHKGVPKAARQIILELFAEGLIRVLVVTRDAGRSLPVKAGAVVVLGTQYVEVHRSTMECQLKDYTLLEVVEMQSSAIHQSEPGYFTLFCPIEDGEKFNKFLNDDGLPLESQLLETGLLTEWYRKNMEEGTVRSKQDAVEALSFTFLGRRAVRNPAYYDLPHSSHEIVLSRIVDRLEYN